MLGLTFVLLTVVFRSVVIAGTAVLLNLLSVGAAYGLLVLVFQHGIGVGLLGFSQADTIEAWVPLFLFSVLFGLSMDYQVFLLSRIRERYDSSEDTTDAVLHGVASTARIITGAALIIVAVFLGFAMGDLIMFQQMGFEVAIALLIDATVIRSVILPSSFIALGSMTERIIVASISNATATPKPICWNMTRSPIAKPRNTATMISAAPVMIRAVEATPCSDGLLVSPARVVPLADPAEQEHLVVHRQPEEHREEEERHPGLDRVRLARSRGGRRRCRAGRRARAGRTRRRPRAG